ncbi:hypothetical protein BO70DRAFT_376756 [Aspergillus heteromorphus CBS 117.55]|uniref:DNA replication checkpoint mediator MRC1 domain-containing protein n=1 Tax=Aspergillus heteromorphus CBS 117.55 TaxID=1448321 RepID=A0A317X061_9EURO|nr:uncharacterized protein BO70DRAFT_376756 [Aspergillus heteromorphus CBS 117.55]PWY90947.1 hypothetical protein BO70DRAFT_376756 [Aspergillus heteromorphus CBS 117.55]
MSSPSPSPTRRSATPEILTPGRKIRAMLAAFDSDSDSDTATAQKSKPERSTSTTKLSDALKKSTISTQPVSMSLEEEEAEDEDDEDIIMPKGRMAARLQGAQGQGSSGTGQMKTAFDRVRESLRAENNEKDDEKDEDEDEAMDDDEDDDEDLPTAGPRRRGVRRSSNAASESDRAPSPTRSDSPLFVSSPAMSQNESDPEEAPKPQANARFLALVAQKRKQREEKEQAEAEKRAARAKQNEQFSSEINSGSESEGENGSGRKLTQQAARPARKASKKALEDMHRETQRMSRNMQLAHQAQTKKKITKESFFARFNFMQPEAQAQTGTPVENSSSAAASQNTSDAEAQKEKETPRTSPVLGPEKVAEMGTEPARVENAEAENEEFPLLEEILANPSPPTEQPIVARMEVDEAPQPTKTPPKKEKRELTGPAVRVRLTREEVARQQQEDSDSDLEVVTSPAKCRRIAAFENVPARRNQESASMIKLKALAHIGSPTRKSMDPAQLSATILAKARQQALKERQDRIQELKAKGIYIETAEERAAMEDELENLVEKARKEAEDIAKQERKSKKGDADDEEDDDWEYSGSEEDDGEGEGEDDDEDEDEEQPKPDGLIESEAGEDDESEDDQTDAMSVDEEITTQRRKRPTRVVSDDEDEAPQTPVKSVTPTPHSVERPQLPSQSSNLMSLTQAFAGTMSAKDGSQPDPTIPNSLPEPGPMFDHRQESDSQMIIKDSQEPRAASTDILTGYTSDARVSESPAPRSTPYSQIPDPSQDAGFVFSPFDPAKRFLNAPPSTVDTVLVDHDSSPAPVRKMKQLKRGRADLSMIEEQDEGDFEINASAFDVMKKAPKKAPAVPFDRKKSKAKNVVEEAAEESDDEYAGLGGASDEEDDEENAYDRQMINDNSGETVDEKQLAALNALHDRNADEKQVAKLLKDITTGALRRRRNGDDEFDLDDSDDELLARRRQKQREFARMRKALLADEKIGEIAENPKKAAFFRAVEDRDDDDDDIGLEFLDEEQEQDQDQGTQNEDAPAQHPAAQPDADSDSNNKRKRPLEPAPEEVYNRPPPHLRRKPASAMSKKPASLAEIRETLSFLTETHDYDSFHEDASMEDHDHDHDHVENTEDDDTDLTLTTESQDKEKDTQHTHPRRTRPAAPSSTASPSSAKPPPTPPPTPPLETVSPSRAHTPARTSSGPRCSGNRRRGAAPAPCLARSLLGRSR